jgi:hypothetical protein
MELLSKEWSVFIGKAQSGSVVKVEIPSRQVNRLLFRKE